MRNGEDGKENDGGDAMAFQNNETQMDPYVVEEILRLRMATLRKEEMELQAKLDRLKREREKHVRTVRRLKDEGLSAWHHYPVLHDRYQLIRLIGKGGFSEVFQVFFFFDPDALRKKLD